MLREHRLVVSLVRVWQPGPLLLRDVLPRAFNTSRVARRPRLRREVRRRLAAVQGAGPLFVRARGDLGVSNTYEESRRRRSRGRGRLHGAVGFKC